MLEVPAPVSSFEVWLFEEGLVDQDLVWLCHSRGKGSLSMSPCFPKALLQSRSTEWSLAAPDVKGDPPGFWSYLASCYSISSGFPSPFLWRSHLNGREHFTFVSCSCRCELCRERKNHQWEPGWSLMPG